MKNNILVEFGTLIDTDLGLLKLIKNNFNNPKYIDIEYLNNINESVLIYTLVKRKNENPLSLIIKDNYKNNIKNLKNEFYQNNYKEILKYSKKTNILNLMKTYLLTNQITINVLCKNILEEQFIKKIDSKFITIVEKNYNNLNIDKYDCIFIKIFKDILKFKNLNVKNIYVARYNFNFEESNNILLKNVSDQLKDSNLFFIIDVYDTNLNALG